MLNSFLVYQSAVKARCVLNSLVLIATLANCQTLKFRIFWNGGHVFNQINYYTKNRYLSLKNCFSMIFSRWLYYVKNNTLFLVSRTKT